MKVKMSPPRRFPMHDGRTIIALTHKKIPFKIEHKCQSVKIENPRSSWTMALSRSIINHPRYNTPSTTNKSIIIILVFVAVRNLDVFLQFMFGLFLSSGRTSNQVTEARMILPAPAQIPFSIATPSPCHPSAALSAASYSQLPTQTVLNLEVSLSKARKGTTTDEGKFVEQV